MAKRPLTRSQLVKKLDRVFSRYIRYKYSYPINEVMHCKCITCGRVIPTKKAHAGHYIRRGVMTTRWNEFNVHVQDAACNTYNFGEPTLYRMYIVKTYGESVAEQLDKALVDWKRGKARPIPIQWLRDKLEEYEAKLKELNVPK